MKLLYIGTQKSNSGYGKAGQGYIKALKKLGHTVIEKDYLIDKEKVDISNIDKVIYHCPVEWLPQLFIAEKPCIVITTFEADRFPPHWIDNLNQCQPELVIVPSKYNEASLSLDFYNEIAVVPHVVENKKHVSENLIKRRFLPDALAGEPYIFYSISEWNTRKNFEGLIKAYYNAFQNNEEVLLIIKTKIDNQQGVKYIERQIQEIKNKANSENYPKIYVITERLTDDEILSLHTLGNCYVSAHRAEGFGLGIAEAMSFGKPVICTGYSGNLEFCDDSNSILIGYMETFVYGQVDFDYWRRQYKFDMKWAEPNLLKLSRSLHHAIYNALYETVDYQKCAEKAKKDIKEKLSVDAIGKLLKEIL